ncbi:hypothetical protein C0J52_12948 [Blattella germanica]|nr:hypothetical protein C0J52_12948 [Blattella germanica]
MKSELTNIKNEQKSAWKIINILQERVSDKAPRAVDDESGKDDWRIVPTTRRKNTNKYSTPEINKIPVIINRFVVPPESDMILGLPETSSEDFQSGSRPKIKTGKPKKKSSVLVLGDSHARNCAINIKDNLDTNHIVSGIVKPGAQAKDITDEHNLEKNDTIVLWAGTNDISKNAGACGLKYITKFVAENYKSKIMVMSAPHRYDLPEWSCVNTAVNIFNKNLKAKMKRFHYAKAIDINLSRGHTSQDMGYI